MCGTEIFLIIKENLLKQLKNPNYLEQKIQFPALCTPNSNFISKTRRELSIEIKKNHSISLNCESLKKFF